MLHFLLCDTIYFSSHINSYSNCNKTPVYNGEPTEITIQVAQLHNLGLVLSTAKVTLLRYTAFIHYLQHLLTHLVDMPYSYNSW